MKSILLIVFFSDYAFGAMFMKLSTNSVSWGYSIMFSSKSIKILTLKFTPFFVFKVNIYTWFKVKI